MPDKDLIWTQMGDKISGGIKHIDHMLWDRNYIFKFGQSKYNQQSIDDGTIRLVNSSTFTASNMNRAQKDDENQFIFSIMSTFLKDVDRMLGLSRFDRNTLANGVNVQFDSDQDYLVWCAAASYDPRIPVAFDYDSVLIIKDKKRFEREIKKAAQTLRFEPKARAGRIKYFDPYLELSNDIDIPFTKHFRFSYQDEYRVVAEGDKLPEELFLEIPNLSQYAEIVPL